MRGERGVGTGFDCWRAREEGWRERERVLWRVGHGCDYFINMGKSMRAEVLDSCQHTMRALLVLA